MDKFNSKLFINCTVHSFEHFEDKVSFWTLKFCPLPGCTNYFFKNKRFITYERQNRVLTHKSKYNTSNTYQEFYIFTINWLQGSGPDFKNLNGSVSDTS